MSARNSQRVDSACRLLVAAVFFYFLLGCAEEAGILTMPGKPRSVPGESPFCQPGYEHLCVLREYDI